VLDPCFLSWNKRFQKCSIHTNTFSNLVHIPISEHFSFAKIMSHLSGGWISRRWLNSMIITQVHLVPGTIKATKMWSCVTQRHRCIKNKWLA
jgi:hypothetical protein